MILSTEHGPRGGDEINKIVFGGNYGWPISSYGEPYFHQKFYEDENSKNEFSINVDLLYFFNIKYKEQIIFDMNDKFFQSNSKIINNFNFEMGAKWRST